MNPAACRGLPIEERYELKVDRSAGPDNCHPWTASRDSDGYGLFTDNKTVRATRWAYEHFVGPIEEGLCVLHQCDNPPCQNRAHWFLGTNDENMADKVAKYRQMRGEAHNLTHLTEVEVLAIRERYRRGGVSWVDLATEYGVAKSTIGRIIHRTVWKHLAETEDVERDTRSVA